MNEKLYRSILERHPDVSIVVASKYLNTLADFMPFLEAGVRDFGENRAETLIDKNAMLADYPIRWHYIGTLQTKKVKKALPLIDRLHALDRLKLAEEIEKRHDDVLPCFVQVNISGESRKHGFHPDDVERFVEKVASFEHIRLEGLMGMAEETDDLQRIRSQFSLLRTLKERLRVEHPHITKLSMGMSQDYEIALAEGADVLRLGRILLSEETYG